MSWKENEPEVPKEDATTNNETPKRRHLTIYAIATAIALLYFGGWMPLWHGSLYGSNDAIYIGSDGVAVQFNGYYYGAYISNRYFYSPVISWLMLGVAIGLFRLNEDEDENNDDKTKDT